MKQKNIDNKLDQYGLDRDGTVEALREIEYEYIQYKLGESIEEEAHVHKKLPDKLHILHSVIKVMESK